MSSCPYGFRIVGALSGERRPVDAGDALTGYAICDTKAEIEKEAYLSAFTFDKEFRRQLDETGSPAGYDGPCAALFLWWDIDHADELERALSEARGLAGAILERYRQLDEDDLLLFFSGSKGFHVGLPTFWQPAPSPSFNRVARRFCERLAEQARVTIDAGIYDKVRPFRAPNSRHPTTDLYKRRISFKELMGLSLDRIRQLAERPEPFDLPAPRVTCEQAAADWQEAEQWVQQQAEARQKWRAASSGTPTLNRLTLDFIRDGAAVGDRHRLLFSAAANLKEFDCPQTLAHALLTGAALDSGLPPKDVHRTIEYGLARVQKQ